MNELIFPSADSGAEEQVHEPSSRYVCFKLSGQAYGIAVHQVREVLRMTPVASVPGAPSTCRGVINLRGQIVSVLDLRLMLGLASADNTPETRMLVVDHPQGMLAFQVDEVLDLVSVPDAQLELTPSVNSSPVPVTGIVHRASGPLFVLDPKQLIEKTGAQVAA